MTTTDIIIKGAREHNLQGVDLVLPRGELICFTGVSGSGKSSLAFDTLYAEGQRRYVESLSSYARQFMGQMPKPDVDLISGLSPSISISQKSAGNNPRSTVGTITEIYDFLRVLYARIGTGYCPSCNTEISAQTREQILGRLMQLPSDSMLLLLAPLIRGQKGEFKDLFEDLRKQGYARARVDGRLIQLAEPPSLDRQRRHNVELVIDRLPAGERERGRLAEAIDAAMKLGDDSIIAWLVDEADKSKWEASPDDFEASDEIDDEADEDLDDEADLEDEDAPVELPLAAAGDDDDAPLPPQISAGRDVLFSAKYSCGSCGKSFRSPTPQMFSFNSPQGMCESCDGLGTLYTFVPDLLIPEPRKSVKKGCFELVGDWKAMGRYKRHIYQGVAESIERQMELPPDTMLLTPWCELDPKLQHLWLWGTGDLHVTYTWRGGASPVKYGGTFAGIIPELLEKYKETTAKTKLTQFEGYMDTMVCPECNGKRLNSQAGAVRIATDHPDFMEKSSLSLPELCDLPVSQTAKFLGYLQLDELKQMIAGEAVKEIRTRLGFLLGVGLEYLTLNRTAPTLSGGESQRIRLAGQIGSGLVGVLYILDEPSIGLHPRDNDRLIETLLRLRDAGNTLVVVEHDEDTMRAADRIIDFGPGPGVNGGYVVAQGKLEDLAKAKKSITGQFLAGKETIPTPEHRRDPNERWLRLLGARHNNLKNINVDFPVGLFICVTGVSGSGKSSMVNGILEPTLRRFLNGAECEGGEHDEITGLEHLDKVIAIDQSAIGRTPRSNPATYVKVFDEIRKLFAQLPEAKKRGYTPGRFSFNVSGGRCEACDGNGATRLDMDFLADVWVTCPVCEGARFNRETLSVRFKDHSISDVLNLDVSAAYSLFENIPKVADKLKTLIDVGLEYLKLGQPSPTLSGGEAQRIKLSRELSKKSTGSTMYVLDEPTTGLHFADIRMLLGVLNSLVERGNTVLVIEHNLDVIKTADWIIDIGPEGGAGGGTVVAAGTPEEVAQNQISYTSRAMRKFMYGEVDSDAKEKSLSELTHGATDNRGGEAKFIEVEGAEQHNLKSVDAMVPRDKMSVFCGPSGSGKSSLAMDTIYAEGQRRYVESLSSYARQFIGQMQKPIVERIEGLSPAVALEQKNMGHSPRSTVGTVTEVYDYLRILMARLGKMFCPDCSKPVGTQTPDQITDKVLQLEEGTKAYLLAPIEISGNEDPKEHFAKMQENGFQRIRIDGTTSAIQDAPTIDMRTNHKIELVVDRVSISEKTRGRLAESIELALGIGGGIMDLAIVDEDRPELQWKVFRHSQHLACECCGRSFEPLTPHHFSFNSAAGYCRRCEGLGTQHGTNPDALLRDRRLSLMEGAVFLWPKLQRSVARQMMAALGRHAGIPIDRSIDDLTLRERNLIFHGTGDEWIAVRESDREVADKIYNAKRKRSSSDADGESATDTRGDRLEEALNSGASKGVLFKFRFKGLYPSLELASKLSPTLRAKLEKFTAEIDCSECGGTRLRDDASAVRFRDLTIGDIVHMPLSRLGETVKTWKLDPREKKIAGEIIREIRSRIQFLLDVGLDYLSIGRGASTLSGGEAQRIRLAGQLGSGLCGVLYVLDEPTIGLHPRDNHRLLSAMHRLRDLGNTLLVVEHDKDVIAGADHIFDFGPKAGRNGGQVVADGSPEQIGQSPTSVTGPYISDTKAIPIPSNRRMIKAPESETPAAKPVKKKSGKRPETMAERKLARKADYAPTHYPPLGQWITIRDARENNLRGIDVHIPLGTFTAVTGPSGSGKSSLIDDILYPALARKLHRSGVRPGRYGKLDGIGLIDKVIRVDQSPLGNTPSSNPATYTGAFDLIRNLYTQVPEAKTRGYTARQFSFNVPGGRCEVCEGTGGRKIEMHFLPDVWVPCEECGGSRYTPETLEVKFHGNSISDVLNMSIGDAVGLFENQPKITRILQMICDVGLDYVTLGQSAPTLSGGEAQRIKLAAELARPDTGRTLYLLDEPTTGLHFDDIAKLLNVLQRLVDVGNTVLVIEHNLDIIKAADWILDIGPEAGAEGGQLVFAGTPEQLSEYAVAGKKSRAKTKPLRSYTGEFLAPVIEAGPYEHRDEFDPHAAALEQFEREQAAPVIGEGSKMPWEEDGRKWHTTELVDNAGDPVSWEEKMVLPIVQRMEEADCFEPINFNHRNIVEVKGPIASRPWFMHLFTSESWWMKLKLRVPKGTFNKDDLPRRLPLPTLNQMEDIPAYSNEPRVRVHTDPKFQEIEIRFVKFEEMDRPEFWHFLDEAIAAYAKVFVHETRTKPQISRPSWRGPEDGPSKVEVARTRQAALQAEKEVEEKLDAMSPWRVMGRKWHTLEKGFPEGEKPDWPLELVDKLLDKIIAFAGEESVEFGSPEKINVRPAGQNHSWCEIETKDPMNLRITVDGPHQAIDCVALGKLGIKPPARTKGDIKVTFEFWNDEKLNAEPFDKFLKNHWNKTVGS
ncbi:UvrABC system protein A [Rosistilla oblonga]|uniref:excinuclease ABC subunit UvrA n=1 Tax=Rosistilla oblonga TaxID=2527990 RepID=UPI0011878E9C|nr:excinuclease ABC subunit UvrA [Rosistilla oblonga]QDV10832.1 UvrABC system protein A [Rosistilla oblonga]